MTTSYPLLLRLLHACSIGELSDDELERCLHLIESFVVRRAVCGVPTNNYNKLFLQWSKSFPEKEHEAWLHQAMSAGGGGRRFPSDSEFAEAYRNQPQYGRGATRFILLQLEEAFGHKEPVDLSGCTIEHVMPQTLSTIWKQDLGPSFMSVHEAWTHTIGNLTLTGYNTELGNLSFGEKKGEIKKHSHRAKSFNYRTVELGV